MEAADVEKMEEKVKVDVVEAASCKPHAQKRVSREAGSFLKIVVESYCLFIYVLRHDAKISKTRTAVPGR